jgi:hypothetical protein
MPFRPISDLAFLTDLASEMSLPWQTSTLGCIVDNANDQAMNDLRHGLFVNGPIDTLVRAGLTFWQLAGNEADDVVCVRVFS